MRNLTKFLTGLVALAAATLIWIPVAAQTLSPGQKKHDPVENLIVGDFSTGKAAWTQSGGTFAIVTSGSNLLYPGAGATFQASGSGQYIETKTVAVPQGLADQQCQARLRYRGLGSTYKLRALNSSNVALSDDVTLLDDSVNKVVAKNFFRCPAAGTLIKFRLESTASGGLLALAKGALGEPDNIFEDAQPVLVGESFIEANGGCNFTTTSGSLAAFGTDVDCVGPTIVFSNSGSWQTTDADLPQQTINGLPPGRYVVTITGFGSQTGAGGNNAFAVSDGTTTAAARGFAYTGTVEGSGFIVAGTFNYTDAGNRTFRLFGATNAGTLNVTNATSNQRIGFRVERFPTVQRDKYISNEAQGWYLDGVLHATTATTLGTSTAAEVTRNDNDITLVVRSGSRDFGVLCDDPVETFEKTCAVGNENIGFSAKFPEPGTYDICISGAIGLEGTFTTVTNIFHIAEVSDSNSQTVISNGSHYKRETLSDSTTQNGAGFEVCESFALTTSGFHHFGWRHQSSITGSPTANRIENAGGANGENVRITVRKARTDQNLNLVGQVTSSSPSAQRVEWARVADNADCSSSPCTIGSQSGSWLTSVTRTGTGAYTLNIASGTFSASPACVITTDDDEVKNAGGFSATAFPFITLSAGVASDTARMNIHCFGPK